MSCAFMSCVHSWVVHVGSNPTWVSSLFLWKKEKVSRLRWCCCVALLCLLFQSCSTFSSSATTRPNENLFHVPTSKPLTNTGILIAWNTVWKWSFEGISTFTLTGCLPRRPGSVRKWRIRTLLWEPEEILGAQTCVHIPSKDKETNHPLASCTCRSDYRVTYTALDTLIHVHNMYDYVLYTRMYGVCKPTVS